MPFVSATNRGMPIWLRANKAADLLNGDVPPLVDNARLQLNVIVLSVGAATCPPLSSMPNIFGRDRVGAITRAPSSACVTRARCFAALSC